MLLTKTLAAATAAMITLGALGMSGADAATVAKKPMHHMLVCKTGSAPRLVSVKIHGKWHKVWRCYRIHHKHHKHHVHHMTPKPKMPKAPKAPKKY